MFSPAAGAGVPASSPNFQELDAQHARAHDNNRHALQSFLSQYDNLVAQNSALKGDAGRLPALEYRVRDLADELKKKDTVISSLWGARSNSDKLEKMVADKEKDLDAALHEVDRRQAELRQATMQMEQLRADFSSSEAQLRDTLADKHEALRTIDMQNVEINRLRDELARRERTQQAMDDTLKDAAMDRERAAQRCSDMENKAASLQNSLDRTLAEAKVKEEEKLREIGDLKATRTELEGQLAALRKDSAVKGSSLLTAQSVQYAVRDMLHKFQERQTAALVHLQGTLQGRLTSFNRRLDTIHGSSQRAIVLSQGSKSDQSMLRHRLQALQHEMNVRADELADESRRSQELERSYQAQYEESQSRQTKLQTELDGTLERSEQLKAALERSMQNLDDTKAANTTLTIEKRKLQERVDELEDSLRKENIAKHEWERKAAAVPHLEADVEQREASISQLQTEIRALSNQRSVIEELEARLQRQQRRLDEHTNSEADVRLELERLRQERDSAVSKASHARQSSEEKDVQLERAQSECVHLERKVQDLNRQVRRLERDNDDLAMEAARLKGQVDTRLTSIDFNTHERISPAAGTLGMGATVSAGTGKYFGEIGQSNNSPAYLNGANRHSSRSPLQQGDLASPGSAGGTSYRMGHVGGHASPMSMGYASAMSAGLAGSRHTTTATGARGSPPSLSSSFDRLTTSR